ncbi:VanW family protein [Christensenella intestinihominis]|uniref:VanW family protein n=1 Tax=Christensenella intestinihominis TaxID=1851429 RepID=UPI00082DF767|nr:VanW family protein [Christensenella intestinihominis]
MTEQENRTPELLVLQERERGFRGGGPSRKWIWIVIGAIAVAAALFIILKIFPGMQSADPNTFAKGVTVLDCDLSGLRYAEGEAAVQNAADRRISGQTVTYEIAGKQYTITGNDAGMTIDYSQALADAFAYGKNGDAQPGGPFDCPVSTDAALIREEVSKNIPDTEANDIGNALEKTVDEENQTTGYELKKQSEAPVIDTDKLVEGIAAEMAVFGSGPVIAEEADDGGQDAALKTRGSYETAIEHPELDSAYNIWKASDLLNTTEIGPGETWSMKEALGALEEADGWRQANELIDGQIVKTPGGGLNHLASTIYAAALASELEIEDHASRPWPADYIDAGLDADIFSDGADLAFKNTSDSPVYLVIECNAEGKTLTVSFLGQPFEDGLKRQVVSETVTESNDLGGVTAEVSLEKGSSSEKLFEVEYQPAA